MRNKRICSGRRERKERFEKGRRGFERRRWQVRNREETYKKGQERK